MNREAAKEQVKGYLQNYLASKGIDTRRTFRCLNPDHADKHPSMSYDRNRQKVHCFACSASYDIFDLIGLDYGLSDPKEIFKKAYDLYNITIDDSPAALPVKKETPQEAPADYMKDFKKWAAQIAGAADYLQKRGISLDTAKAFMVGYNEAFKTGDIDEEGRRTFTTWRGLIFPTSKSSFVVRNMDIPKEPQKKNRYRNRGTSLLFNKKALYNSEKPVYVTEGEIDALSIIEVGGAAVGLGSKDNYKKLVDLVKSKKPAQALILALDRDEEGQKTEETLAAELEALKIPFYRYNPYGSAKDANEALTTDRAAFIDDIRAGEQLPTAATEEAKEEYLKTAAAASIDEFLTGISDRANTQAQSTGFNDLDELLDGGLYEGFYVCGAVSSLGKTTFCLQIADNLAEQGQDVIIISLEMAKTELMAKSISRNTYILADDPRHAKTTRGITCGAWYANYNKQEKDLINAATERYKEAAAHIFIYEGVGDVGVEKVREIVTQHIEITGKKPVVIIDYLQILAPYDLRASDKQNTDKAVLELKRISRDFKITVLGVSSFNRENYTAPVNLAAFKESGAIEYGSDVLIALQYYGFDYEEGENETARRKRINTLLRDNEGKARQGKAQQIQVKILKQRNGRRGDCVMDFYPAYNYFCENKSPDWKDAPKEAQNLFNGVKMA